MPPRKTITKLELVEDFISIIKKSIIMQMGILIIFIAVAFVIATGGSISMFGLKLIDSEVPIEVYSEEYKSLELDSLEE
tara:strand:+ start:152 stop:388 length:237 start_codon:yes stop_codon:yes gene_type:complete